ncbi:hypothetical protein NDU88_004052 [Pleurodeles waltl]|uniref:Uncharacterized protein n=1 Tax=Pleurodeles waltl TaxID=8319 RepID=A0AAV7L086_PLEWA|nr:hypothetical protein NDU88_004052 [Pleurodeles waltl]
MNVSSSPMSQETSTLTKVALFCWKKCSRGAQGHPSPQGPSRDPAHLVSPRSWGRGSHHQPPQALLRLRSVVLSALLTSGVGPPPRPQRAHNEWSAISSAAHQGQRRHSIAPRVPGTFLGLQGTAAPCRSRLRRDQSTLRRAPPLSQRSVVLVCFAGSSGAGPRFSRELTDTAYCSSPQLQRARYWRPPLYSAIYAGLAPGAPQQLEPPARF